MVQIPLKIIDLQNDFNILVAKTMEKSNFGPNVIYEAFWESGGPRKIVPKGNLNGT